MAAMPFAFDGFILQQVQDERTTSAALFYRYSRPGGFTGGRLDIGGRPLVNRF